ncbi:MAG TPA: inositol monophosphatase family protein [Candidatus Tumulicola sp.]|nr:inositol monophosphatase family protein [Candidatus Tumulicola sp.]
MPSLYRAYVKDSSARGLMGSAMRRPDPLETALEAAAEAGAALLAYLAGPREIAEKGRRADLVTDADRASEAIVLARLRAAYPDATIVAEESGTHAGTSDERWIVDPLDGTTNFAHRYPLFCISIAYERAGELIAGVVYAPAMDEWFAAERGAGARLNARTIGASNVATLAGAMTCTGFHPADFERNAACFRAVSQRAQAVRRDGSAALDLAYVACGRFDGFWEFDLNPWDVAAGTLLVREAGGTVTRADGSPASLDARSILATNGRIHAELAAALE